VAQQLSYLIVGADFLRQDGTGRQAPRLRMLLRAAVQRAGPEHVIMFGEFRTSLLGRQGMVTWCPPVGIGTGRDGREWVKRAWGLKHEARDGPDGFTTLNHRDCLATGVTESNFYHVLVHGDVPPAFRRSTQNADLPRSVASRRTYKQVDITDDTGTIIKQVFKRRDHQQA
jgi:hypothetical protein